MTNEVYNDYEYKNKIRCWCISDTHGRESDLKIPDNIDIVIHSGDISTHRAMHLNIMECTRFLEWYQSLEIKHKILCAGNHDLSIERRHITPGDIFARGITYLENASTSIMGLKIWGSPITPSFGVGWAFNKARHKLDPLWGTIPEDIDILITHGPPKGILDLSFSKDCDLEYCGDASLRTHVLGRVKPMLMTMGHIHNNNVSLNQGVMKVSNCRTLFSNASVVEDGQVKHGPINNGNIFEIFENKITVVEY